MPREREGPVRAQLARILASDRFAASGHLREFLSFVVEAALTGRDKEITAYRIGAQALNRGERFDPSLDPIVRIEATKLRRALERYYLTLGRDDPVRVEVPTGGYAPTFAARPPPPAAPSPGPDPPPPTPAWRSAAVLALLLAVVAAAGVWPAWPTAWGRSPSGTPAAGPGGPALLVLPFRGLSGPGDAGTLADGLTGELVTALHRFPLLRLFSRTAGLARPPDGTPADPRPRPEVDYVLEGDLRLEAPRLRVTASLVDARTGELLWSEGYDRELAAGVIAAQEGISGDIAARIAGHARIVDAAAGGTVAVPAPEHLLAYSR
jgi:TolB-like protein